MATRTELLCYQLGLRLFQAMELHDPQYLEHSPTLIRLSAIRLQEIIESLQPLPQLAAVAQSARQTIALWIDTPHYYLKLGCAESWQYDGLMQQHREQLALIQEEFRKAARQHPRERRLEHWLALGVRILSNQGSQERQVVDSLMSNLGLAYDAVLPVDDRSVSELDDELRESYFRGLEDLRTWCSNGELWDTAELGLQRLWESVEEEPEQDRTELRGAGMVKPVGVAATVTTSSDPPPLTPEERDRLMKIKQAIDPNGDYIGTSDAILRVFETIQKFNGPPNVPVLLIGETGVGKSEIAAWIHRSSDRKDGPFGRVSAAESPGSDQTIWRGKWAGYGPNSGLPNMDPAGQEGYLQKHAQGTLFLDEVADCSSDGQTFLLDVIDRKKVRPAVGHANPYEPDVRMIFATNKDLQAMVSSKEFRHDLYDRIRRRRILIPPLRDRREDIFDFVNKMCTGFEPDMSLLLCLLRHAWPGNVRELMDVLSDAVLEGTDRQKKQSAPRTLTIVDLGRVQPASGLAAVIREVRGLSNEDCREEVYRFVHDMLQKRGWEYGEGLQVEMARILGVSESTVSRTLGRYDDATPS